MKTFMHVCIALLLLTFCSTTSYASDPSNKAKEVYRKSCKSIVTIVSTSNGNKTQGSGVIYTNGHDMKSTKINSWIVTNAHVVNNSKEVAILYNDKNFTATVDYIDEDLDLAILFTNEILEPAEADKTNSYEVGDKVYAIGSPFGLSDSISEGIISGKRIKSGVALIQNTASISPGNSGGGLFDDKARFIGVTTFKLSGGENINFAISTAHLDEIRQAGSAAIALIGIVEGMQIGINPKDIDRAALIKWLITTKAVNGTKIYKEALEAYYVSLNDTNDNTFQIKFDKMVEEVKSLLQAFLKDNKFRKLDNKNIIKLACSYPDGQNSIWTIDLDRNVVHLGAQIYPAVVYDSFISWKYKLKNFQCFESINRFTGEVTSTARDDGDANFYHVGYGKCSRVTEKQF